MKWKDILEGMPLNTVCEVMQENGNVSLGIAVSTRHYTGIKKVIEDEGTYRETKTFLIKVVKYRLIEE